MNQKLVPPVDADLFRRAFKEFYSAIQGAPPEDREPAWIGALCQFIEDEDQRKNICMRMGALDEVIHSQRKEISATGAFPASWIEIAATAPLYVMGQFDLSAFTWTTPDAQQEVEETKQFLQQILDAEQFSTLQTAADEDNQVLSDTLRAAVYDYLEMRRVEKDSERKLMSKRRGRRS
jgi:hypothetical protein